MSTTHPEPTALPPTPQESAAAAMKEGAQSAAKDMAWRKVRRELYRRLPKMLHPLIPGHSRSFAQEGKRAMKRWLWGVVFSVVFFAVFALLVLGVLVFVVGVVLWAIFL